MAFRVWYGFVTDKSFSPRLWDFLPDSGPVDYCAAQQTHTPAAPSTALRCMRTSANHCPFVRSKLPPQPQIIMNYNPTCWPRIVSAPAPRSDQEEVLHLALTGADKFFFFNPALGFVGERPDFCVLCVVLDLTTSRRGRLFTSFHLQPSHR